MAIASGHTAARFVRVIGDPAASLPPQATGARKAPRSSEMRVAAEPATQIELFEPAPAGRPRPPAADVERVVAEARDRWAPDARENIFDVKVQPRGSGVALVGMSSAG